MTIINKKLVSSAAMVLGSLFLVSCKTNDDQIKNQIVRPLNSKTIPCAIGEKITTIVGATFECVRYAGFVRAWKAPNGVVWSEASEEKYNNAGPYDEAIITKSPAADVCNRIGAKLPASLWLDIYELSLFFDLSTEQGRADMDRIFPDMKDDAGVPKWFWTSSPRSGHHWEAHGYKYNSELITNERDRKESLFVRCVSR